MKENCTGCAACADICPSSAISMREDIRGFLYPVVDSGLCKDCDLCNKICQSIDQFHEKKILSTFASYSLNEDVRFKSSSGGIFSEIALWILSQNGFVVGAAFDAENNLKHIIIDNPEDLERLRRSKYIQSDVQGVYIKVKKILERGDVVLFTGTPCQIRALKYFLNKEYDNLYTIDLFCHGVPSPLVFRRYIEEMQHLPGTLINFREKTYGWNNYNFNFETKDGKYSALNDTDTYFKGFLSNLFLRDACYQCKYNSFQYRCADISIGDFWEVEKFYPSLSDNKGVSEVIIYSEKGWSLINNIRLKLFLKKVEISEIIKGNPCLISPPIRPKSVDRFFENINKGCKCIYSIENELGMNKKVAILNHAGSNDNFGAVMVAYSMEKIVRMLGYYPTTINIEFSPKSDVFENFRKKFLHMSELYALKSDFSSLNKKYNTFIVGSDQVWRNWWGGDGDSIVKTFFLDFADHTKNLIAYAASFGINKFEGSDRLKLDIATILKSFSKISVREKSGVDICREEFKVDAKVVLDPTLLIESNEYNKIIESENLKKPDYRYLAYMIFPGEDFDTKESHLLLDKVARKLNLKTECVLKEKKTIAQWLHTLKNADFVLTDSFHGVMFSIIFEKQFICLINKTGGEDRFLTIAQDLDIKDRFFYNQDEVNIDAIVNKPIDYKKIGCTIAELRKRSIIFLQEALAMQVEDNGRGVKKTTSGSIKKKVFLLGVIPFLKIKRKKKYTVYYLFCFIPIFRKRV